MEEKHEIYLGIWSVLVITLILGLAIGVVNSTKNVGGAYTASTAFIQYTPKELCEKNGCEAYLSDTINYPAYLQDGYGTRVNCICNGEIRTFPILNYNLGIYNPGYYPNVNYN